MKVDSQEAAFSFTGYKIKEFFFSEPSGDHLNLNVEFNPSGRYNQKEAVFTLLFSFSAAIPNNEAFIKTTVEAYYKFENNTPFEKLPPYFFMNSIAIVFPYLRAFVTTLTSVANIKPLILPTLNLSALEVPLRDNTTVV